MTIKIHEILVDRRSVSNKFNIHAEILTECLLAIRRCEIRNGSSSTCPRAIVPAIREKKTKLEKTLSYEMYDRPGTYLVSPEKIHFSASAGPASSQKRDPTWPATATSREYFASFKLRRR